MGRTLGCEGVGGYGLGYVSFASTHSNSLTTTQYTHLLHVTRSNYIVDIMNFEEWMESDLGEQADLYWRESGAMDSEGMDREYELYMEGQYDRYFNLQHGEVA